MSKGKGQQSGPAPGWLKSQGFLGESPHYTATQGPHLREPLSTAQEPCHPHWLLSSPSSRPRKPCMSGPAGGASALQGGSTRHRLGDQQDRRPKQAVGDTGSQSPEGAGKEAGREASRASRGRALWLTCLPTSIKRSWGAPGSGLGGG